MADRQKRSWGWPALGGALATILVANSVGSANGQVPQPGSAPLPQAPPITLPDGPPPSVPGGTSLTVPDLLPGAGQPVMPPMPMTPVQPGSPMTGADPRPNTTTSAGQSPPPPDKPKFDINWNNGVFFQSADKNFSAHIGATVQYDFAWYQATPVLQLGRGGIGSIQDGTNLRRGRFFMEGTLYQAVDYKFELEFFNGIGFSPAGTTGAVNNQTVTNAPGPTDAWVTVKDVPFLGNVRVGSQKEWFSLEHLNSYRYLEFMERSYLFDFSQMDRFNNGFSPGVSVFRTWLDDRAFSAVGVYKNDSDLIGFGLGNGQYAVTGRLAFLPLWMPDEQVFWHVGGAMSHRDPVNGQVQINVRDDVRNAPFPLLNLLVNTGPLTANSQDLYNLETAAVWGPVTFQAEYTANVVNGTAPAAGVPLTNLFFQGGYAEVMCFLTGESRTWNTKQFYFNRVNVLRPLRLKREDGDGGHGFGAWELAARYTYLDVSNKFIQAGRLDAVTLGLNWYLNPNTKFQFNYDMTRRGDTNNPAQGTIHAFGTRVSVDW